MADFDISRLRRPQPFREGQDIVRWAEEVHQACEEYALALEDIQRRLVTGWTDLRAPASAINPQGSPSPPAADTVENGFNFDGTGNNVLFITMQMPHEWESGSDINPHVHWMQTAQDEDVHWYIEYRFSNPGEEHPSPWIRHNMYTRIRQRAGASRLHQISHGSYIDMTGYRDSVLMEFMLWRDSTDSYSGDALFKEYDVHYFREDFGSPEEFGD